MQAAPTGVRFPFPWATTPDVPDLGCFVRQKHTFEADYRLNRWVEPAPWEMTSTGPQYIPHQAYVRVACGHAAFHERVGVTMLPAPSTLPDLFGRLPDWVLGGDYRPTPTDWVKYSPQSNPHDYWLIGDFRDPAVTNWQADAAVGHSFDLYENGTLSRVGFDDTGGDLDYDDMTIEVAIVYRRRYFLTLEPTAELSRSEAARFDREVLARRLVDSGRRHPEGN